MDFLTKHWGAFPRHFPCGLPLGTSDFIPEKSGVLDWIFGTCNFSIILRGRGFFERAGRRWEFHAPFVITQWPGEQLRYGPLEGTWSEWYLVYHRSLFRAFQKRGLIDLDRPVWPVSDPGGVVKCFEEFTALARGSTPENSADLADRIAERAILLTLLPGKEQDREQTVLQDLAARMRENPGKEWDFALMARQLGYSESTFRRRWKEAFGETPCGYLSKIRLIEAGKYLAESRLRIKEIATAVGFADELYFSRFFHAKTGISPREYRRSYHIPAGVPESDREQRNRRIAT